MFWCFRNGEWGELTVNSPLITNSFLSDFCSYDEKENESTLGLLVFGAYP